MVLCTRKRKVLRSDMIPNDLLIGKIAHKKTIKNTQNRKPNKTKDKKRSKTGL